MRILIGSCGGLTGSFLARQFKKINKDNIICGFDISFPNVTSKFLDEEYIVSKASSDSFLDELLKILIDKKIDFYVPTNSKETIIISKYENLIREKWKGYFIISPYETFERLDRKDNANKELLAIGVPTPKIIYDLLDDNEYPIFMKPACGSGGKNSCLINDAKTHKSYLSNNEYCFFEYIKGTEYTVDCFFDESGKLISYNQRIRQKNMGGAVVIAKNDYSFDIYPYLLKMSKSFCFKGCVNFQYILRDNIPYFIDINLRYASGGLPLSVRSGLDVPKFLFDLLEGKKLDSFMPSSKNDGLTMYRYFEEWFQ